MSKRTILGGSLAVATLAAVATAGGAQAHIGSLSWGCNAAGETVFVMNTYHGDEGDNGNVYVDGVAHPFTEYSNTAPAGLTKLGNLVIDAGYVDGAFHSVAVKLPAGAHVVSTGGADSSDGFGDPQVIQTACGKLDRLATRSKIKPRVSKPTATVSVPRTPRITPPVNRPNLPLPQLPLPQ